jgi:hypothetical protein
VRFDTGKRQLDWTAAFLCCEVLQLLDKLQILLEILRFEAGEMLVVVTCRHVFKLLKVASQYFPTRKRVSKNHDAEPNASLCGAARKEIRCRRDFALHHIYLVDIGRPPQCVSTNFGQLNSANFTLEELRKLLR